MGRKLTLEEIMKVANSSTSHIKPRSVKIPSNIKKYDRIYVSQERTKKLLKMG